ncbi:MAG: transglutaminase domain-containing protein, partial [Desulfobulbaceae bacterium]|nr:transglutaminase domain-containing protein [Desulfobulbaceae bacterium]
MSLPTYLKFFIPADNTTYKKYMLFRIIKITLFVTWIGLLGMLISRDLLVPSIDSREIAVLKKAGEERFYGVWLENKRIGYVAEQFLPGDGEVFILKQQAHIRLKVLDTVQPIDMVLDARLDRSMRLEHFRFNFTSPFYSMKAEGSVQGTTVHFSLDTGQARITDSITLKKPPMLPLNQRGYLLQQLPQTGDKLKVPFFDPMSLAPRESVVEYRGMEKIFIGSRVRRLHHFEKRFSGMRVNFWLDDKGRIVKEISPAGFVFLAEPEFKARDIQSPGNDLLALVAVPYSGSLPPEDAGTVSYRLTLPPDVELDMHGGRQHFNDNLLTLTREQVPAASTKKPKNGCDIDGNLQASRYVQAEAITGATTEPLQKVRLLAQWIYQHLEKRPVLGQPDALTTLRTMQGDCNEHAALFAALARASGIPTVIATGITLYRDAF